jgi:hypothetical protein
MRTPRRLHCLKHILVVAVWQFLLAAHVPASARSFGYGSLLSTPVTLFAFVQTPPANGTVVVQGGDTAQPSTPFTFSWGDGSSISGFFPQQHTYQRVSQNYVVTITALENSGATQQLQILVFFVGPSINPQTPPPSVTFSIPSQPIPFGTHYDGYAPPSGETVFADSAFGTYSRGTLEYLLTEAAAIAKDFANDNVYLLNGIFDIEMLENVSFGGGYSFWDTTPMSVGYGSDIFSPNIQWHIVFNELGKDTALNTPMSFPFGGNTDGNASEIYSETMGDIFSYAIGHELVNNAASYGIGNDVVVDMSNDLLAGAGGLKTTFDAYVAGGSPFSSWNPYNGGTDPTGGALTSLAWKFIEHAELQGGDYRTPMKRLMWLLQRFDSSMLSSYDPHNNTPSGATFRSTLMVAALSYAFTEDLRAEFRALNFPIDDSTYQKLYNAASQSAPQLSITTTQALPQGAAGTPYSQTLVASWGTPPYRWSVVSATLPAGLTLSSVGTIEGTPTNVGSSAFTIQVVDSASATATQAFTLTINPRTISITTQSLLPAASGLGYSEALAATGGIPPYSWSIASGVLPSGLSMSAAGAITGTPSIAGAYSFIVKVTDASSTTVTQGYSLTVISGASLARSGVLAHIAAGGGWTTVITLINSSSSAVAVTLALHGDDGSALTLPVATTQQGVTQKATTGSVTTVMNPNTTLLVSTGDQIASTFVGWADVLSSGPVGGFAIFRSTPVSGSPSEGTVPLQTQFISSMILPYDNTAGFVMGVAVTNLSVSSANITATVWDDSGVQLGSQAINVAGSGHTAFVLPNQISLTTGKRGFVRFQSGASGGIGGLGLRFSPFGTFTSVPTM